MSLVNMKCLLHILFSLLILQKCLTFQLKFNKINCNSTDEKIMKFERCILKAVSRNEQYFSFYAKIFQKPLKDVQIRFEFMKRANGWKPFLYDVTIKCDELRKLNPITKILWKWLNDVTNFNNTCPYDKDVELYRLSNTYMTTVALSGLPLPNGEYRLLTHWQESGKVRGFADFYGTIY